MVKATDNKEYKLDMYVDAQTSLDIDEILNEKRQNYVYKDGKMGMINPDYVSSDEVLDKTSNFNKQHKVVSTDISEVSKSKWRKKTRHRFAQTIVAVGVILLVGVVFALTLYPQAQLSEISRDNSDLKDEIAELKKEILDAKGESDGVTDMDSIRAQAMALGMQDTNVNQIVNVPMPGSDRLVSVATYDSNGISDDALEAAQENLKEYYHRTDAAN